MLTFIECIGQTTIMNLLTYLLLTYKFNIASSNYIKHEQGFLIPLIYNRTIQSKVVLISKKILKFSKNKEKASDCPD